MGKGLSFKFRAKIPEIELILRLKRGRTPVAQVLERNSFYVILKMDLTRNRFRKMFREF